MSLSNQQNFLLDRKYEQPSEEAPLIGNLIPQQQQPYQPLIFQKPLIASRFSPNLYTNERIADEDNNDNEEVARPNNFYAVNRPLQAALLAAARPEIRVLRNTDEEENEQNFDAPNDNLQNEDNAELLEAQLPYGQDVIMVDVIDNNDESKETKDNDDGMHG